MTIENDVLRLVRVEACDVATVDPKGYQAQMLLQKFKFASVENKYSHLKDRPTGLFNKLAQTDLSVSSAEAAAYEVIWPGITDHKLLKSAIGLTMESGFSYSRFGDRVLIVSRYVDIGTIEQSRIELAVDTSVSPPVLCYQNLEDESDFSLAAIRAIDPQFFTLLIHGNRMHFVYAGEDYTVEWLPV